MFFLFDFAKILVTGPSVVLTFWRGKIHKGHSFHDVKIV